MINDIISDDDMIILNVWTISIYMHIYVYMYMCKYRNKHMKKCSDLSYFSNPAGSAERASKGHADEPSKSSQHGAIEEAGSHSDPKTGQGSRRLGWRQRSQEIHLHTHAH